MTRGTTPTYIFTLPEDVDLSVASTIYVTIKQGEVVLTKSGASVTASGNTVEVSLTQTESLSFAEGFADVQVNWTYSDGGRACTEVVAMAVRPNLVNEVLT